MDPKQGVKQIHINGDAIPGRGEDDLLTLLAMQVLDATKINTHTDADKAQRYNAAIAALHDIAPVGALEGMLATQLIATHMATMDCYKHINATNDRNTHASHLNQVNKLSRTYVALLEALNRHRGKGQQKVTVEHVHVHQGGQAIVGHVEHQGGGVAVKPNGSTPCS
jgi:ATP-dependent Clp protease adapter protein ClpS